MSSVSADRSGMVALRFLSAAGACVILLCLAFGSCKSHCNGSMKVANGALAEYFSSFWLQVESGQGGGGSFQF